MTRLDTHRPAALASSGTKLILARINFASNYFWTFHFKILCTTRHTLHALFTLVSEDFTQRHAQKRVIAGTKCVQVSM